MIGVDVLVDTNAVIGWIKQDSDLAQVLVNYRAPAITIFTLGELLFGALKSSQPVRNKATIELVKNSFLILLPDESTYESYAAVRLALRRKGKPIPENDVWIAAQSIQHNLPLMTRDAHFHEVDGLKLLTW